MNTENITAPTDQRYLVDEAAVRALLERVEQASGADREIDRDLFHTIDRPDIPDPGPEWRNMGITPVTASIDAALALVERVLPPGYGGHGGKTHGFNDCWWEIRNLNGEAFSAEHSTLSLALCTALLRALISLQSSEPRR